METGSGAGTTSSSTGGGPTPKTIVLMPVRSEFVTAGAPMDYRISGDYSDPELAIKRAVTETLAAVLEKIGYTVVDLSLPAAIEDPEIKSLVKEVSRGYEEARSGIFDLPWKHPPPNPKVGEESATLALAVGADALLFARAEVIDFRMDGKPRSLDATVLSVLPNAKNPLAPPRIAKIFCDLRVEVAVVHGEGGEIRSYRSLAEDYQLRDIKKDAAEAGSELARECFRKARRY